MKIAILITGQLRTYDMLYEINKKIFKNYDIDYFLSIDTNNKLANDPTKNYSSDTQEEDVKKVIELYKPKKYFVNGSYDDLFKEIISMMGSTQQVTYYPRNNNSKVNYEDCLNRDMRIHDMNTKKTFHTTFSTNNFQVSFEQYYFVKKAYDLLFEYQKQTNIQYDLVMRLRFDQYLLTEGTKYLIQKYPVYNKEAVESIKNDDHDITNDLDLNFKLNNLDIIVFASGSYEGYLYVNDQFWITNFETSKIIYNFYDSMPSIIKECCQNCYPMYGCGIEHFFVKFLLKNKLTLIKSSFGGIFIRAIS